MTSLQAKPQPERLALLLTMHGERLQAISYQMNKQGIDLIETGEIRGADMVEISHEIGVFGRGCIADAMEAEGKERPPSSWIDPGPDRGGAQWEEGQ